METDNIQSCQNCRYFTAYYVKTDWASITRTGKGRCVNDNILKSVSKKCLQHKLCCEFWQPESLKNEERKEYIRQVLRRMAKQIGDIALILQDDEPRYK